MRRALVVGGANGIGLAIATLLAEREDGRARYTPTTALMVLWDRYPTMRDYIAKKYADYLAPNYTFGG